MPRKFTKSLLLWFRENKRDLPWRKETDPYRVLVAEKLLQQTDVGHVLKVYNAFFEKFPDLESLHGAQQFEIENVIKPLGFWRIRARDYKNIVQHILHKHQGKIPSDTEALDEIPGIGRYVSVAIACFHFNQQLPIVDVNVRRIIQRLAFFGGAMPSDKKLEAALLEIMPHGKSKEFNWALLDFSAAICSRKPKCEKCFAREICKYYQNSKHNGD